MCTTRLPIRPAQGGRNEHLPSGRSGEPVSMASAIAKVRHVLDDDEGATYDLYRFAVLGPVLLGLRPRSIPTDVRGRAYSALKASTGS